MVALNEHLLLDVVRQAPLGVGQRHLEEVRDVDLELGQVRAGRDEAVEEPAGGTEVVLQSVLGPNNSALAGENQQFLCRQPRQSGQTEQRGLGCLVGPLTWDYFRL